MTDLFLKIANMSISTGWVVLVVLVLRFVLKKAPKWLHVLLWGMVGLRSILPFSVESIFSLMPSTETIPQNITLDPTPTINTGLSSIDDLVNPVISNRYAPNPAASANPLQISFAVWANIWMLGMTVLLAYTVISYLRLRHRVDTAVHLQDNIFQSERIASPFVLGMLRPKIYLPFFMDAKNMIHVITHEQAHIRRRDHWWKPLGFLLLTLHWFNPLMWLSYILLCRDIELACDEKAIKELDAAHRADYSQALLACSVRSRQIAACPLAFGEESVKSRVKSILQYKKPSFWLLLAASLLCIVAAVCFLTDPIDEIVNPAVQEYTPGAEGMLGNVDKDYYESIHPDFAIGADRYGRAVFKEPYKAFDSMLLLYADGISLIKEKNALSPISYTNFNAYKQLGIQMTVGSDMELEQAAFVSKFLDIFENSFERSAPPIPAPATTAESGETASQSPKAREWFDNYGKETLLNAPLETTLNEIPGITFRWTDGTVVAIDADNNIHPLYSGMPVWSVFFADLTGDDIPDICSTVSYGSGMIDTRIIIYDYMNGVSYTMAGRGYYDYSLVVRDGILCYNKYKWNTDELVDTGYLIYADEAVQLVSTDYDSDKLERAINRAVLEHNAPAVGQYDTQNPYGHIHVESHVILGTSSPHQKNPHVNDFITVYLLVLQQKYQVQDGHLDMISSSYVPTELTFSIGKGEGGGYFLQEYWEPRNGAYYEDDIRAKFPEQIADAALDHLAYADNLETSALTKAEELLQQTSK